MNESRICPSSTDIPPIEIEYGRLPQDILKYISLLGATPDILFNNPDLIISSPFMTYKLKLFIAYENKYDEEKYVTTMIEDVISFSKGLKVTCDLFISGYDDPDMNFITTFCNIQIINNKIYLKYSDETELTIYIGYYSRSFWTCGSTYKTNNRQLMRNDTL